MSTYAFYDYTSNGRRRSKWILAPMQRILRRVLRPMFLRLRDLLQRLSDEQQVQLGRVGTLEHTHNQLAQAHQALLLDHVAAKRRVEALEAAHQHLTQVHQSLILDQGATARRIVLLEDLILKFAAEPVDSPQLVIPINRNSLNRHHEMRIAS